MRLLGNLNAEDRISIAKIHVLRNSPFFSYLVEHLNYEKKEIGTCGVDSEGNFYYDENFVNRLDKKKLAGVFLHETLHLALGHPARAKGKNLYVNGMSLWNIATDIVVNNLIDLNAREWVELPEGAILPKGNSITIFGITIEDISEKSAEEIYWELAEKLKQQLGEPQPVFSQNGEGESEKGGGEGDNEDKENKDDNDEGNGDKGDEQKKEKKRIGKGWKTKGKVKRFDKHEDWGKKKSEENKGKGKRKDWGKILTEAYNYAKQRGEAPAGFEREFEVLKKGKVNWRAIIRQSVKSQIPADYTWTSPNRKYISNEVYLPSIKREGIEITFAIDTSGSMSEEELSQIITEIISIARSFSIVKARVITHDSEVQDDYEVRNGNIAKIKKLKIHGGGGTSHIPLFEYIEKKYPRTKLLISFTDGYSAFPDKTKIKTIFALTGIHVPSSEMPKWAMKVIEID